MKRAGFVIVVFTLFLFLYVQAQTFSADFNNDGKVDVLDLSRLLSKWGTPPAGGTRPVEDINQDGNVNVTDLGILLGKWGSVTGYPTPPPGSVIINPGDNIQAKVDAAATNTTFFIKTGIHRRQSILPKTGNSFLCEPGAILDGENATQYAFRSSGGNPDNVTIRGCVITRYVPAAQYGAILAGGDSASNGTTGWVLDALEVHNNANLGIRLGHQMKILRSNVHHNGTLGIGGVGDDILVESTEIAYNNPSGGGLGFESGGTKFVLTNGLIVRNNFVHHNTGPGLWADIGNDKFLFEGNRVEDNLQEGIVIEISYSGTIRNNTVKRNGLGDARRTSWLWGSGIGIHASGGTGIDIYGNVLEGNAHGIALVQQNRGASYGDPAETKGSYLVQNINVHDNTVFGGAGSITVAGAVQDTGNKAIYTGRNNRFTHNSYYLTGMPVMSFAWDDGYRTKAQWNAYGLDVTGTFIP